MSERRRFNRSERVALYLAADGRCSECGTELEAAWHADHVTPFARSRRTDVADGQALCPPCNLAKGARMPERQPLRWQLSVQADYLGKLQKDYLLVAVPGAGKTFWTMHTARELIRVGRIGHIAIVAPTTAASPHGAPPTPANAPEPCKSTSPRRSVTSRTPCSR